MSSAAITLLFSGVVTAATVAYAVLTWQLVTETRRLRQSSTDPAVIVYVTPSSRWINMFELVVHNYGAGPAIDLSCQVQMPPEDLAKHGLEVGTIGVLKSLRSLAPGQIVRGFLGSGSDIFAHQPVPNIPVTVSYAASGGTKVRLQYELNFNQYYGLVGTGEPVEESIARTLKDLAAKLDQVSRGGRLNVKAIIDHDSVGPS